MLHHCIEGKSPCTYMESFRGTDCLVKGRAQFRALPYVFWFREEDQVFCFHIVTYEAAVADGHKRPANYWQLRARERPWYGFFGR